MFCFFTQLLSCLVICHGSHWCHWLASESALANHVRGYPWVGSRLVFVSTADLSLWKVSTNSHRPTSEDAKNYYWWEQMPSSSLANQWQKLSACAHFAWTRNRDKKSSVLFDIFWHGETQELFICALILLWPLQLPSLVCCQGVGLSKTGLKQRTQQHLKYKDCYWHWAKTMEYRMPLWTSERRAAGYGEELFSSVAVNRRAHKWNVWNTESEVLNCSTCCLVFFSAQSCVLFVLVCSHCDDTQKAQLRTSAQKKRCNSHCIQQTTKIRIKARLRVGLCIFA